MLSDTELYRKVKAVDIQPILAVLSELTFVGIRHGSKDPNHPECSVIVPGTLMPESVTKFVESLGIGGNIHRFFFRKLSKGQSIPPHIDSWVPKGWTRYQVPITSHPDIKMRWPEEDIEVYLEPGYLYEVCYWKTHEVIQPTDIERIHMQIDQINTQETL